MVVFISGEFRKLWPACRGNSPQAQIADLSSTNAVSFLSARTTKRFPSPRCAIRVYDDAGNVVETHEHKGDFQRVVSEAKQKAPTVKR
jgi:hypothetical protein